MDPEEQLSQIRDRIDAIDTQLLDLISDRARCAQAVAEVKLAAATSSEEPRFSIAPSERPRSSER